MAASRMTTDATTSTHDGNDRLLNSPQPRSAPSTARATAVVGSTTRMRAVLRATIARLPGHRVNREYARGRRGAAASDSAIAANTVRKTPSLMVASSIGLLTPTDPGLEPRTVQGSIRRIEKAALSESSSALTSAADPASKHNRR